MPEVLTKPLPPFTTPLEQAFLQWYKQWATQLRLNPNPDDPNHFYDYRRAWLNHVDPQFDSQSKQYHWPSEYKLPGHPRTFIEGIDTRTGEKANQP